MKPTAITLALLITLSASAAPGQSETTIGPDYHDAPETTAKPGVPQGTLHEFKLSSQDSRIYPGLTGGYVRQVCVYIPAGYKEGTPAPLLVAQDGMGYKKVLPPVLDNLIHEKRVPPMVAIMINSGGGDGKGSERGLEYDTVSDRYANFIETEVLPKVEADYKVKISKDPDARATMGGSSGGACAFTMAWFRPDLYHRVLTYSGTYVAQESPTNPAHPRGAWEYHAHLIPESDPKPIRIWLEVSEHDNGANKPEESWHNWVMANQRMAAALKAKGYAYRYVFAKDAKHTDGRVTRQTLAEALTWVWEGHKGK